MESTWRPLTGADRPSLGLRGIQKIHQSPNHPALAILAEGMANLEYTDIMTTGTDRIQAIFDNARDLQADALEMLAQGRVRNAAEKAWGAMKQATDPLSIARTGEEPERTPEDGIVMPQGMRRQIP